MSITTFALLEVAMPITFNCSCGKSLRVSDEHAGRRVKCPACNVIGFVPGGPEPEFEVVEKAPPRQAPSAKKQAVEDDDDEDDGRGYGVAKPTREEEEAEEREQKRQRERKKRRRQWAEHQARESRKDTSERSFESGIANSGTLGGLLAMVIAVVWFVVAGFGFGVWFIYPPFLFIVGLIAFFKGLLGANSDD
jgi:hypothetical protein